MKMWLLFLLAYPTEASFHGVGHSKVLRGMFEMVQAQVKVGTGINDEVEEVVDDLLDLCMDIIIALQDDHRAVQQQLDSGRDKIQAAEGLEDQERDKAMDSDMAVNSEHPEAVDRQGCRQRNMDKLIEWERCMGQLEACRETEWEIHADYNSKMIWDWTVSPFGTTPGFDTMFRCEWRTFDDNDPSEASLSDCPHWDTLVEQVDTLKAEADSKKEDYDLAVVGWKDKYNECEQKRIDCTTIWDDYSTERNHCYNDHTSAWGDKCVHGERWQELCYEWWTHAVFVDEVRETDGGSGDRVSEVDRQTEYVAVKTIQCMLRHYRAEKGEFWENVTDCPSPTDGQFTYLEWSDTYITEIGDLEYYDNMPNICGEDSITYSDYDWKFPTADEEQEKCDRGDACDDPYWGSRYYEVITPYAYAPLFLPGRDDYLTFDKLPFEQCPVAAIDFVGFGMAPKFFDEDIVCAYHTGEAPPLYCEDFAVEGCSHIACYTE